MPAVLYGFFQSGDMLNAAYETNWYENTSQIKRLLRTMIMRARKRVEAKAGLIGTIDLPLFATVRHITNKQTHTHTHTHIYIYIRTRIPTYIYPHMHAYIQYIRACIHTYIYLVKKFPVFNITTWFIIVFTGTLTDCTSSCPFLHHLICFV